MAQRFLGIVLGCLIVTPGWAAELGTDEIIAKYTDAIGGSQKLRSVFSLRTVSRVKVGGGFNEDATVISTMKVPNMVYTEIVRGDDTLVDAFDGRTKWAMIKGGKAKKAPDQEAKVYAADTGVMIEGPLVNYREKGHRVEYQGIEDVNEKPAYKMHIIEKSGNTAIIFLDTQTYLPIKQISHIKSADGPGSETVSYFLNYKRFDGFTMATSLLIRKQGGPPMQLKIEKIDFNFDVDEALFRMPQ